MASNLFELRKAAGYRNASDFAEEHGIPISTYARYESSPDKIPVDRAWQLADILGTTIDVIVGRKTPDFSCGRGEVQLEYDGLTPEVRELADELREFVLQKDARVRERKRHEERLPYEMLCYQYERQMLSERLSGAAFGELVMFGSAEEARAEFESYLQEQAAMKRSAHPTKAQEAIDNQIIEKIMAAYDRTHGKFESDGMSVAWRSMNRRAMAKFVSGANGDGDAKA